MPKRFISKKLPKILNVGMFAKKQPGAAPGTVEHIGEKRVEDLQLSIFDYDDDRFDVIHIQDIEESKQYLESPTKTWLKVDGVHDIEKLKSIWSYFNLHPLVQEDIVNTAQRPKVEQYEENLFFVLRMIYFSEESLSLEAEQVSIVLGKHYVLSFQETDQPFFQPVIDRLNIGNIRIRKFGVDYLAYALIDAVVDYYFTILEGFGERVEEVENELLDEPNEETFQKIHALRRDLIYFRKSVWPVRDVLNSTIRDESVFINQNTKIFLRDVYDHVVQVIDGIENFRDVIMGMHDLYMTHVSNRMNEVMKVLTIIATIFIPLTFVAGIYGMNFNPEVSPYNMPELNWYWGYPAVIIVMIITTLLMVLYFKRKNWI